MDIKVRMLIAASALVTIATFIFAPAMEQPLSYHDFADANQHLGIPNFGNVMSNLAYLIPGILGLNLLHERHADGLFIDRGEVLPFYAVFLGGVFVAFGSGYYHLNPVNETLVADRMTMTVGFIGVFCVIIAERISVRWALKLLAPLLVVGLFSVIYWIYTEIQDAGDLRLYGLVQFLPLLAIAVMLVTFPAKYTKVKYVWLALGSYAAAKLFEHYDKAVWELTQQLVSGHTVKHLVSGLGFYFLLRYIRERSII